MINYFVTVMCGVFTLIGLGIAYYGLNIVYEARASASWLPTNGEIKRSQVASSSDGDTTMYAPEVHYLYRVNGQEYTGIQIYIGDQRSSNLKGYAQNYVGRYPVGKQVVVYYNPREPKSSVLEPGVSKKSYLALVFGLGFAAFSAYLQLLFWLFED